MLQHYNIAQYAIETLLSWIKSNEIAIPEIQRPFVWKATQVRNLLDSLYRGYPVGYLITWSDPKVKLKDGSTSSGKRILIDGQQRIMALMTALLGHSVLTKGYETIRIRIAFNPVTERFEVSNSAIDKDPSWIPDVATVFAPNTNLLTLTDAYTADNPGADRTQIYNVLDKLKNISHRLVGTIELLDTLDIEAITEIFVRVNSAGTILSQADFAMSKIATNETHGGNLLRKAIDYFCHLSIAPDFFSTIERNDPAFAQSEFLPKMKWLKDSNNLYNPTYTDMLRVAFTSEFGRGELQTLVALLSGRNFETREYEESIVEKTFARLKKGILDFMNQTHFERITMILQSSGFLTKTLVRSRSAIDFAYILYLRGRRENLPADDIERVVRRWYAMSILTGRYSGNPETAFDTDIRGIAAHGVKSYAESAIKTSLPDDFWTSTLPQNMVTSSASSSYFIAYQAAQSKLGDKGFLSTDITVRDLLLNRGDKHHIFPRKYLQEQGLKPSDYNQIANFVMTQNEINIAIGGRAPQMYFAELIEQARGGERRYGGIADEDTLRNNLSENCIPLSMLETTQPDYKCFLVNRRKLMSLKIKKWFVGL